MDNSSDIQFPASNRNDREIIEDILKERESDADVVFKLYAILNEASLADEENIDTELIDECVKAINLIAGYEGYLEEEKIMTMRHKVDQQYKEWSKIQRQGRLKKLFVQSAAGLVIFFFMSTALANALGYNPIEFIVDWGKDTLHLSSPNNYNEQNYKNLTERKIHASIEEALQEIAVKPLLPEWVPDGFAFTYAEELERLGGAKIVLYYENHAHKNIVFDFEIYEGQMPIDAFYEKDDNEVIIYEKDKTPYYIFHNLGQVQAVWASTNIVYNITGDVSVDEMKEIIDSMNGGT